MSLFRLSRAAGETRWAAGPTQWGLLWELLTK